MSHRTWWLVIAGLALLGLAFAVREATRPAAGGRAADQTTTTAAVPGTGAGRDAADGAAAMARVQAMTEAVDTLHAYLAVLFKPDRSEADGYWIDGRPAAAGESDLRQLDPVTGVRIDNARPEPLDDSTVPDALQIPVKLRIGGQGPLRHYSGHYRMRKTGDGWRITSASIDLSPAQR